MKTLYATILDANFIVRALALRQSLMPHIKNKTFVFFCIDDVAADTLEALNLKNSKILRPSQFETADLLRVRGGRKANEYCWTIKPAALLQAMDSDSSLDWVVYVDADTMAFADPDEALAEAQEMGASALLTPHGFHGAEFSGLEQVVGRFNAGYAAFRCVREGREILRWWLDRCLEKCSCIPDEHAYGDQKYLNTMATRFPGVLASPHPGLNLAPWNLRGHAITPGAWPQVDGRKLLLYHFQGFKIFGRKLFNLYDGDYTIPGHVRRLIYRPYVAEIRRQIRCLREVSLDASLGRERDIGRPMRLRNLGRRVLFRQGNMHLSFKTAAK
ncbi:MAG: hypothetical protein AB1781_08370 [Pseudomonadota bacterium]